jgi:transcriptional regulator with XRE-family HTH domain
METARKLFGKNVARLADREGFSRKELADFLGVQQTMVSRWISGKILPTKHLDGIARYFRVGVKDLFVDSSEPLPRSPSPPDLSPVDALKILASNYGYALKIKHKK